MKGLLSPNHLCSEILRVKTHYLEQENSPGNFETNSKQEHMSLFKNPQIRDIHKELEGGKEFTNTLKKYGFQIHFDHHTVTSIISDQHLTPGGVTTLLHMYLAWFADTTNEFNSTDTILLLNGITAFCRQDFVAKSRKLVSIFHSCFYNLTEFYLKNCNEDEYSQLLSTINDFFTFVRNLNPEIYQILVIFAKNLFTNDTPAKLKSDAIACFDLIIAQSKSAFPRTVAEQIIVLISDFISTLEIGTLMLFSHLSFIVEVEFLLSYVPVLSKAIVKDIESSPPITPNIQPKTEHFVIQSQGTFSIELTNVNATSLDSEIDLTSHIEFPGKISLTELMRNDIQMKLQFIVNTLNHSELLCEEFAKSYPRFWEDMNSDHLYDQFAAYFYVFEKSKFSVRLPMAFLCNNAIFSPKITIFEPNIPNWQQINTLRATAIEYLLKHGSLCFSFACSRTVTTPLLFAEIVHRFIGSPLYSSVTALDIASMSQTIMRAMMTYQHVQCNSGEEKKILNTARKSLFMFLNHAFTYIRLLNLFFRDQFFVESFLSLLFEAPAKRVVLAPLVRYLSVKESNNNDVLIQGIMKIIDAAMPLLNNEQTISMCCDMIVSINEVVILDDELAHSLEPITSKFPDGLIRLPKGSGSESLLIQYLAFLANISKQHKMTLCEAAALETSIKTVFGSDPGQSVFIKIVQLMAGQQLHSFYPSFVVHEARAIWLLLGVFSESTMVKDVFAFVASLCQYDRLNCVKAHDGEVDLLLIDMLKRVRNSDSVDFVFVASAFSLLMLMMNVVCSVSVVQSFVSLLCQIDGKYLPSFHKITIKSLSKLLLAAQNKPMAFLPLTAETNLSVQGLLSDSIGGDFSVAFWVYVHNNSPQYKPVIISFKDQRNQELTLYLQDRKILFSIKLASMQYLGQAETPIPTERWSLVTCTLRRDIVQNQSIAIVTVDRENGRDIAFPLFHLQTGSLAVKLGGVLPDSDIPTDPFQLAAVGLFQPIPSHFVPTMLENGPSSQAVHQFNPHFYFMATETNGKLHMKNAVDHNIFTVEGSIAIRRSLTFTDVLIDHCFIDILIPVFAQWDLKFKNGEAFPFMPATTIELLENALQMSVTVQEQFAKSAGVKAILHLMMSNDPKHLTYQLYMRWYSLLSLMKSENLQKQILEFVIVSPELWMKSNAEAHRRILKHWARTVFPSSPMVRCFTWIMSILRLYYWYEPMDALACTERIQINVSECRSDLLSIAYLLVGVSFTETDMTCLISHILTCRDCRQTCDLLQFMKTLIEKQPHVLMKTGNAIATIQYLFNVPNSDVIASATEVIIAAHRAKLVSEFDLVTHLDIILHQLTANFISDELFDKLLNHLEVAPELFPICSWMAVNLGNRSMRKLLTKVKAGAHLVTSEFWAIWMVVGLFKADEKLQRFIARFLSKCSRSNFVTLFATIEVIGRAIGENIDNVKSVVCLEFGKLLLRDDFRPEIDDSWDYFQVVRHLLFFRRDSIQSEALMYEFNNSVFSDSDHQFHTPRKPPRSPQRSPKSDQRRRARHSLCRSSLDNIDHRYSPALAEKFTSSLLAQDPSTNRTPSFRSKRTSLLALDRDSLTSDVKPTVNPKIVSMMPADLDEKINIISKDEFYFTFGLRLRRREAWCDQKLAEQSLEVFRKYPDSRCAETLMAICAFLLHYNQSLVQSLLPTLNMYGSCLGNVLPLFMHHAEKSGFQAHCESGTGSFLYLQNFEKDFDRLMKTGPLRFLKHFLRFQSANSSIAFDIFGIVTNDFISLGPNFVASYSDSLGETLKLASKRWSQYWNHFTVDYGPWRDALPALTQRHLHFQRDFTHCRLVPVKTRRNFHFDDHSSAKRNKTLRRKSNDRIEKLKDELTAHYNDEFPSQLFEIVESKETKVKTQHTVARCIIELPCELITIRGVRNAQFALLEDSIILSKGESTTPTMIKLSDVTNAFFRTRFHHPTAMEIFTKSGKNYFINFPNIKSLPILKTIKHLNLAKGVQCEDFKTSFAGTQYTEMWVNRRISNFEYLMRLNMASGRTFNDSSQYHILPWVLRDFTSESLDLSNPSIYRDLTRPVGALNESRLRILKEKTQRGMIPYLYPNGYTCPMTVFWWLIRQEPFTTLHIELQDGSFDDPARQFTSMNNAFISSVTNTNDFRELIPEFFSTPEFLKNTNEFDFGAVDGEAIGDVVLPPWAKTPFDFVYLHRKALESEYVSAHLQHWIDLVWGEKQRGEKAWQSDNVFMPEMYDSVWTQANLKNPERRAEIEAILCYVGQIPPQLFERPHPARAKIDAAMPAIEDTITLRFPTSQIIAAGIYITHEIRIVCYDDSGHAIISSFTCSQLSGISKTSEHSKSKHARSLSLDFVLGGRPKATASVPRENIISMKKIRQLKPLNGIVNSLFNNGSLLAIGDLPNELYLVKPASGSAELIIREKSDIIYVACDLELIAVANRDAILSVYNLQCNSRQPLFTIPSFTNQIQCCALSCDYHLVVCGMRNGSILLCSLSDGSISKTIDLNGCRPRKILVTKGWGFIVVYSTKIDNGKLTHRVSLFSVNGDFLRTVVLDSGIVTWSAYKTFADFDYVVMADEKSNVYHFEAYFLNVARPIAKLNEKVVAVSCSPNGAVVAAVTADGNVVVIPRHEKS